MKTLKFSLIFLTILLGNALAQMLPPLPQTAKILERKDVKNHWIACISHTPPPRWDIHGHERERGWQLIAAIRAGHYDQQAEIARLQHNSGAFLAQGKPNKAREVEIKLQKRYASGRLSR